MREVDYEKIKRAIMVCVICVLSVPITLFIAFFIALDKVEAAHGEVSVMDLKMPTEFFAGHYSANEGGTQTIASNLTLNKDTVYTYGNDKQFQYWTWSDSNQYKFIAFHPQDYAFKKDEFYSVKIYIRSQGGDPYGTNWGICVGGWTGSCVGNNIQYGQFFFEQAGPFYLNRPKAGATPDEPEWTRITNVYCYTFIVRAHANGDWVFYRHNNSYSGTNAFYGYDIEWVGSNWIGVVNAIHTQTETIQNQLSGVQSTISTSINQQTTTINQTTVQQNQQTQQTVEEQAQETRDTITDSSTDFDNPDIDTDTGPISGLLTMPITLARAVTNNSSSCSAFPLGNLLGTNLTMPCINLQNVLGSTLYNIIDVICCGIFIFTLRKVLVNVYVKVMSLRNINPGEVS